MDPGAHFPMPTLQQIQSRNSSATDSQQALYGARPQQTRNFSQRLFDTAYDSKESVKDAYNACQSEGLSSESVEMNCDVPEGVRSIALHPSGPQLAQNRPSAQYANVYGERATQPGGVMPSTATLIQMHAQQKMARQQLLQQQQPGNGQLPQTVMYATNYNNPVSAEMLAQQVYRPERNVIARAAAAGAAPAMYPNVVQKIQPVVGNPVPLAQLLPRPAVIAVATLPPAASALYAGHAAQLQPTSGGSNEGSTAATAGSPDYQTGAPSKRQALPRASGSGVALPPAGASSSSASEDTQAVYESQITPGYRAPYYSSVIKTSANPGLCVYGMQMYVYRPVIYPDHESMDALVAANDLMSRLTIPGGTKYVPVRPDGKLYSEGRRFGFTPITIALGSSYFQRLLAVMPHLEYAVRRSGRGFGEYVDALPACSQRRWKQLHDKYGGSYGHSNHVNEDSTLASIQFTCCYLACKVVDRMPMLEMLRFILTTLYGSVVSKGQAYDVESKCLEGLEFRLGPYFRTDDLCDDWPF